MSKKYYSTKSELILQSYTPEAIQELLKSGESKSAVANALGVHAKAFNEYIQKYGLTYHYSRKSETARHNREQEKQYEKRIPVKDLNSEEAEDPVKKFHEMLAKKREKRTLRELKNPYDW